MHVRLPTYDAVAFSGMPIHQSAISQPPESSTSPPTSHHHDQRRGGLPPAGLRGADFEATCAMGKQENGTRLSVTQYNCPYAP
jgi:hypothetical protein